MAVILTSSESYVNAEVDEYQEFPIPEPKEAATEMTTTPIETEGRSCPRGWLMFASSCYYVSSQRRNWDDSREDCLQRNADLVIINSRREQAFLTGFSMAAWIGMTDREEEGTWLWVDGTEVDKDRLQWARGQPDGAFGGEDCGDLRTMITFIGLNDFNCSAITQWICEKRLQ
ncbi:C-type lectin domain family 4 member M-like isoform 2-T2 [Tautogolabrus adspersus]